MTCEISAIDDFLWYGFQPRGWGCPDVDLLKAIEDSIVNEPASEARGTGTELIDQGIQALKASFKDLDAPIHVVPLSGGLDSRAILCALVEAGLRRRTVAITLGEPGIHDFEIPKAVADQLSVDHTLLDLRGLPPSSEDLVSIARSGGMWVPIFATYFNRLVSKEFGSDAMYWSGFMGGELAGHHVAETPSPTWNTALARFAESRRFRRMRSVPLNSELYDPIRGLPQSPLLGDRSVEFDDQLDFALRQGCYIQRVLTNSELKWRFPFLESEWVSFIMRAPRELRIDMLLYRKILESSFPRAFSIATKGELQNALGARALRRMMRPLRFRGRFEVSSGSAFVNYVDMNREMREDTGYAAIVHDQIHDLESRDLLPWINIGGIWDAHRSGRANHEDVLQVLTSLEITLKICDEREL